MAKRRQQFKAGDLARMLIYVLGYRPDEFGLVPDRDGFVPMKELLQALHEEPSWRYVRRSHINEVLLSDHRIDFVTEGEKIRASEKKWAFEEEAAWGDLPKILLAPIRRKAHPVVMDRGLKPPPGRQLSLTPDPAMAERIGMRRDEQPVLLEIRAEEAARRGTTFVPFGDLFLCDEIPAPWIAGPPVPKEVVERHTAVKVKGEQAKPAENPFTAGTFLLKPDRDPDRRRRARGKKSKGWKEDARKMRKRK
ncbi:MAG: RNA 2'-phosphotransferase [Deltaproteobacteria bacterium]|nr:RNA 2'-phosphotransferase [Deltaproteobacteria bacterium]